MTDVPDPQPMTLPFAYVGFDETPIMFANAFLIQHEHEEFIFTVGQLAPPIATGPTDDEIRAQLSQVPFVPIRVLGRFGLTRERAGELVEALQENIRRYDDVRKKSSA